MAENMESRNDTAEQNTTAAAAAPSGAAAAEKPAEDLTVEEAFAQLQELLKVMEKEGTSLEDSFRCYERGMKLIKVCNDKIDRVEKKVQMLNPDGTTQDFA